MQNKIYLVMFSLSLIFADTQGLYSNQNNLSAGRLHNIVIHSNWDDLDPIAVWGEASDENNIISDAAFQGTQQSIGSNPLAVSGKGDHVVILKSDNTLISWGNNDFGQCTDPSVENVIAISANMYHTLALHSDGTVSSWGSNLAGQTDVPSDLSNVIAVSAGEEHSLALKSNGTVIGWGGNGVGQIDLPLDLSDVIAISAGGLHSIALHSDGTVTAWGYNQDQFTSDITDVPSDLSDVIQISASSSHNLALHSDGTVTAWGDNFYGQCDIPSDLSNVVAVSAGMTSLALHADGSVSSWGGEANGGTLAPTDLAAVRVFCDDNGSEYDCSGTCGGSHVNDECGICNGEGIADGSCDCDGNILDCLGVCGGTAALDMCNVCDGGDDDGSTCDGINWVPSEFSSIQAAIDGSADGDTIRVSTGTYYESILIKEKSLVLVGESSLTTIIDNQNIATGCSDTNNGATDIYNLGCSWYDSNSWGCGVSAYNDSDFDSDEMCCACGGGTDSGGSVVTIAYSDVEMQGFTIQNGNQTTAGNGGGIHIYDIDDLYSDEPTSSVSLSDMVVQNNKTSWAGAGIAAYEADIALSNVKIINNTSDNHAAGFHSESGITIMSDCEVSGNRAEGGSGGGLYFGGGASIFVDAELTNVLVSDNFSTGLGPGVLAYSTNASDPNGIELTNVTIVNNFGGSSTSAGYQTGLYLWDNSIASVTNSIIWSNGIIPGDCSDTNNGATDSWGDGCSYYSSGIGCSGYFNDSDFTAETMCCGCGGGETIDDISGTSIDIGSNSQASVTYSNIEGGYSGTGNIDLDPQFLPDDGVSECFELVETAIGDCLDTNNGATDSWWSGCDYYADYPSSCNTGTFDDDDFTASTMCCACGGGDTPTGLVETEIEGCTSSDFSTTYELLPSSPCINTGDSSYPADPDGSSPDMGAFPYFCEAGCVLSNEKFELPSGFVLHPSYPNPFNPSTVISYTVPDFSFVDIKIYSINGSFVEQLSSGNVGPGDHKVLWNAQNRASGVYIVRFVADSYTQSHMITLIK